MAFSDIILRIGADASALAPGLRKAEDMTTGFGNRVSSRLKGAFAGALTLGAVTSLAAKTLDFADNIRDTADRLETSTDEVQAMNVEFLKAGANASKVAQTMEKIELARMAAVADPNSKEAGALAAFGITREDAATSTRFEILQKIGASLKEQGRSMGTLTKMGDLFGDKLAGVISPALQGLPGSIERAKKDGLILEESMLNTVAAMKQAGDLAMTRGMATSGGFMAELGIEFTKTFEAISSGIQLLQQKGLSGLGELGASDRAAEDRVEEAIADAFNAIEKQKVAEKAVRESRGSGELAAANAAINEKKKKESEQVGRSVAGAGFRPSSDALGAIGGMASGVSMTGVVGQFSRIDQNISNIWRDLKMMRQDVFGALRD